MANVRVRLTTDTYKIAMHGPDRGIAPKIMVAVEAITSVQLPRSRAVRFKHFRFRDTPIRAGNIGKITMPEAMADRLISFSEKHFVKGHGDFDCHSFLQFIMGWEKDTTRSLPKKYLGVPVKPDETKQALPYAIRTSDGGTPHVMLGADPGYGFGVNGYEYPLMLAKNSDLIRAFGGLLLEVREIRK